MEVPGGLLRGHGDGRQQAQVAAETVGGIEKQRKTVNGSPLGTYGTTYVFDLQMGPKLTANKLTIY